jgi:uncharacterized protein with ATP-grasp and redox domains
MAVPARTSGRGHGSSLTALREMWEREVFVGLYPLLCSPSTIADSILYLADNAGEIAFDRLLIERLGPHRVTVAVHGAPVINDATLVDAQAVGFDDIAEAIADHVGVPVGAHLLTRSRC